MRFRPLGFLPIASASVVIELQSNLGGEGYPTPMQITAFAVFGILVTLGVLLYDQRNTRLNTICWAAVVG